MGGLGVGRRGRRRRLGRLEASALLLGGRGDWVGMSVCGHGDI